MSDTNDMSRSDSKLHAHGIFLVSLSIEAATLLSVTSGTGSLVHGAIMSVIL